MPTPPGSGQVTMTQLEWLAEQLDEVRALFGGPECTLPAPKR